MACIEEMEIVYLNSTDASLQTPSPDGISNHTHLLSDHTHSQTNHTHLEPDHAHTYHLSIPGLMVSMEDCGGSGVGGGATGTWVSQPRHRHAGTDTTLGAEEENEEGRPKSVLSILQRPISRAKSVLSTHSTSLSTDVKSVLHRLADRVRRPRRQDDCTDGYLSSSSISDPEGSLHSETNKKKLDSLAGSTYRGSELDRLRAKGKHGWWCLPIQRGRMGVRVCDYHVDPRGNAFFYWMGLVSLVCLYNLVAIPLRASFERYAERGLYGWLALDYVCDVVYVLDIVLVQCHLSYMHSGMLESNVKALRRRYCWHWRFWLDLVALTPLEVLYAIPAVRFNALLRLPRLLKVHSVKVFLDRFESTTKFPHVFRVAKLVCYFLYLIHIYTCTYYLVSRIEGFGSNDWVYSGQGISYLRCFYWATLAVATIHDLKPATPTNNSEYTIEMVGYLFGVFLIAVIIGEIRSIVEASNSHKLAVHKQWDRLKEYMKLWKIPKELQDRVRSWYNYAITQQLLLDEGEVLRSLPKKMRADLAIHVHLETLSRVAIFQEFEKPLMRELVLKLRDVLFVPGDFICKKGEIGKEMYIVNQGKVQVIGGVQNKEVLAELGPGSVFGEISLLAVGGGNRRTAYVRSKGFSSLFVLSKSDLNETLEDYPDAQETLKKKARYLLRQDKKREHRHSLQSQTLPTSQSLTNTNAVGLMAAMATTNAAPTSRAFIREERRGSQVAWGEPERRDSWVTVGRGSLEEAGGNSPEPGREMALATVHETWEEASDIGRVGHDSGHRYSDTPPVT